MRVWASVLVVIGLIGLGCDTVTSYDAEDEPDQHLTITGTCDDGELEEIPFRLTTKNAAMLYASDVNWRLVLESVKDYHYKDRNADLVLKAEGRSRRIYISRKNRTGPTKLGLACGNSIEGDGVLPILILRQGGGCLPYNLQNLHPDDLNYAAGLRFDDIGKGYVDMVFQELPDLCGR